MSNVTKARGAKNAGSNSKKWLFGGIAVVVLLALVAAFAVQGGGDDNKVGIDAQTNPVTGSGAPLAPYVGQGTTDPAVGAKIPALAGESFDGKPIAIKNDGKAKVILFAAHWCPHCRKEIPLLAADMKANPLPANVELFTVSTSVDPNAPNYPPSAWFEAEHWPGPVLADDTKNTAAGAFGLTSFPYFVFVNSDNTVSARASGELQVEQFHQFVDALK